MKAVSVVAIIAALAAGPAFAQCGGLNLQSAQDERIQNRSFELAQTRGESRTLREQENRRSGGTGVAPAPNTVKGGGDSADDGKSGTSTATNPDTNTGVQGGSGRSDTTKGPKIKSQSGSDGDSGGSSGGGGSGR